jgi:hypothetical protein
MRQKINILVMVDVEEHELQDAMDDLRSGIENHVAVCASQEDVNVLDVELSPSN